jgi:hypothetical protein
MSLHDEVADHSWSDQVEKHPDHLNPGLFSTTKSEKNHKSYKFGFDVVGGLP